MSDVTSKKWKSDSETVQAYSSKLTQYFQLQNHEYCYSGVTIVLELQAPSPKPFI